jgi:hypothetical protein
MCFGPMSALDQSMGVIAFDSTHGMLQLGAEGRGGRRCSDVSAMAGPVLAG